MAAKAAVQVILMNFVFKMMEFIVQMMNFVFKMMEFIVQMMNYAARCYRGAPAGVILYLK